MGPKTQYLYWPNINIGKYCILYGIGLLRNIVYCILVLGFPKLSSLSQSQVSLKKAGSGKHWSGAYFWNRVYMAVCLLLASEAIVISSMSKTIRLVDKSFTSEQIGNIGANMIVLSKYTWSIGPLTPKIGFSKNSIPCLNLPQFQIDFYQILRPKISLRAKINWRKFASGHNASYIKGKRLYNNKYEML